jgi:hypothetical protein
VTRYSKFFVALAAFLTAVAGAFADGHVSTTELGGLLLLLATAIGVYVAPNTPYPNPPANTTR